MILHVFIITTEIKGDHDEDESIAIIFADLILHLYLQMGCTVLTLTLTERRIKIYMTIIISFEAEGYQIIDWGTWDIYILIFKGPG